MTFASLSAMDPTLIEGVRNQLADEFAKRIFNAIPDVSDCVEFEADACSSASGKQCFKRASQLLYSRGRDLQSQTAAVVRRIFDEKFFRLLDGAGRTARVSLDSMSLLADERLDEEIAVNHCSRRLKEQCEYELWSLTQRIVGLSGIDYPADSQNPAFTQTFSQALMEAIDSLENNAGVRLVVFKTFGPVLLDIVPAVYAAANRTLQARGIEIDSGEYYGQPVLTPESQSVAVPTPQETALGAATVNLALTSALNRLLSNALPAFQPGDSGPVLVGPRPRAEATARPAAMDAAASGKTMRGTSQTLQDKFVRDEQMVGDIVNVMFDRLLADPRMPVQLRHCVARLQPPVLQLACSDRSLLTQVHHPVRKLIDLIAEFGLTIGIGDDDDSTLRSVENIVDGLVQIHGVEPGAFKLAFERLDSFFYHHEEAALQSDENLRMLERHETTLLARSHADREIAQRLQNLTLPSAIANFIQSVWGDMLVHNYLQGGPRGNPWKLGLATLDDIVKSLRPSTVDAERRRLAGSLPASIEMQLLTLDITGEQNVLSAKFFVELHRAQELAVAGKWADIGGVRFVPSAAALTAPNVATSPSAALASLGMACGDWIETRDVDGVRRWRLNWITSIQGTCVFKHYESHTARNFSLEELREQLASGAVQQVRGLGLADEMLNSAFETVSRKALRGERASGTSEPNSLMPVMPQHGQSARLHLPSSPPAKI